MEQLSDAQLASILRAEVRQAASMRVAELHASDPRFRSFKLKAELHAYKKRPKGWSKHQERIVGGMLSVSQFRNLTNADIVRQVAEWFPGYRPSASIMYQPIFKSSREPIERLLRQYGLAIQLRPKETLSTLKKAILAGQREDEEEQLTGEVTIGEYFVVAGGRQFRIDKSRKHPAIRVAVGEKRQYVRIDHLRGLLAGNS